MYSRTFWKDQIKDSSGAIIQAGTPIDQTHMDNIEVGVFEAQVTQDLNAVMNRLAADDAANNAHIVIVATLASGVNAIDISSENTRNLTGYTILPVLTAAGSAVVAVTARQKNGFTVNASAACTVQFIVTGGMM